MNRQNIVIAGAGTMGYSMAEIFARYQFPVTLFDLNDQALEKAKNNIHKNIETLVIENEITREQAFYIVKNISYTTHKECFKYCDIVIESIVENLDIKQSFYKEISHIVNENTILATNTSGLSINEIASAVYKPSRFIGMHWFNPCHLIPLIEIIKADFTADETSQTIYELSLLINKKPVIVNKDISGFVANRIQFAVLREALDLVEKGVVSKEGVDDIMKYGLGMRYACLGPLEVADFGGLDTFYHISQYLMPELCNDKDVPSLLKECYDKEYYGVKSQHGFYDYSSPLDVKATEKRDENLLKVFRAFYKY